MGSLENGLPVKRDSSLNRLSSRSERNSFSQRPRSRFARFVLFKKIDYLQWVCTVAVFLFFVVLFQMFLPGSVTEKSGNLLTQDRRQVFDGDLSFLKEMGGLDFGQDIKFEPSKILAKFQKVDREGNGSYGVSEGLRFGYRKPQLAMVFADLLVDPQQIMMVTIAAALREIGYDIKVHSMEDGPAHSVWRTLGVPVNIIQSTEKRNIAVDWLNYDGVLINNLEARRVIASLLQEPFKSIPLIWTIHESTLAIRLRQYLSNGQIELVDDWKRVFARATVVVYPNHVLPMLYSPCDTGNYFVIPGSPAEAWEVDHFMGSHQDSVREKMNFGSDDLVIAIAGSQLVYGGMWLEHALILQATLPLLAAFPSRNNSKTGIKVIVLSGDSTRNYSVAVEMIAMKLKYPTGTVKHIAIGEDVDGVLSMVDLVIYGSFFEDQSFPDILKRAMCFEKPIIAPDHAMIKKYVDDRVNGYLYSKDNIKAVTQIMMQVIVNGKLSPLARNVASIGKHTAKNMMVSESIEGYSSLLENVLQFPSEVALPKAISVIPQNLKEVWQWHRFESIADQTYRNRTLMGYTYLDELEKKWNNSYGESSGNTTTTAETFIYSIWEEEKTMQMINIRKRREDDELKDRTDQPRGTWDDVYRNAKKADRLKNELHERDDGELERTGQPLTIYEPYLGEGAWPFLHHRSLYRGLGLSSKGRRSGADDVDAPSRLPLLNNPYYRDVLGEYGAYFAIANRIDRIHKNAWIGFQSWRATARKESLSKAAESALLNDIETRRHGDALYFWVRMDKDPRNPLQQEFWSFCDAINAGNCRTAFSKTLVKMYGIKHDIGSLPPMPTDGDTWSVMHSWALPTRSFLEFVMFSRMFVDSLDSQFYEAHHQSGYCYLSLSKDKHCYSHLLELLINVWAYHSARRMIYINPNTGLMQEHHVLKSRRGQMWVKWFQNSMLKGMDEDLAEEADTDPKRRWLWPSTGEVFWKGMYEKERSQRSRDKEKRKQQSKDKIDRIKRRTHQKTIGRYMKPPPLKVDNLNTTVVDV